MVLYLTEDIDEEAVSGQQVIDALNNRQGVLINYSDENASHPGKRYIEPYVYGLTKAGNPCIRAYQYYGDTKRGVPKWKLFRLDRIDSWEPTQETFELEPKARGWAAQAYNQNDGSMSAVYKTVDLSDEPLTDYEKLKAQTRAIKNRKPVTIDQLRDKAQYPEERGKDRKNPQEYTPEELMSNDDFRNMLMRNLEISRQEKERRNKKSGPINAEKPKSEYQAPIPSDKEKESKPLNGSGNVEQNAEQRPIQNEPNQTGPIVNNNKPIDVQSSSPEELMSNDAFRQMIQRNLEISNQEKARRQARKNLK